VDDDAGQRVMGPPPQLMPAPEPISGIPPGLEYLAQIDQVLVHEQVDLFEGMRQLVIL